MKISDLKIGDIFSFHSEPEAELERIVPYGIQQETVSEYNHSGTHLGNNMVIGALAQGYTPLTIQQAVLPTDRVDVYRYHADADELTPYQQQKLIAWCTDHVGTPYDYPDIIALSLLCEINNTTWESFLLRKGFEFLLHLAEDVIDDWIEEHKTLVEHIMGQAVKTDKGLLMCSKAAFLSLTEGAGVTIRIKDDEQRKTSKCDVISNKGSRSEQIERCSFKFAKPWTVSCRTLLR